MLIVTEGPQQNRCWEHLNCSNVFGDLTVEGGVAAILCCLENIIDERANFQPSYVQLFQTNSLIFSITTPEPNCEE